MQVFLVRVLSSSHPVALFFNYEDAEHFANIQYAYIEELEIFPCLIDEFLDM